MAGMAVRACVLLTGLRSLAAVSTDPADQCSPTDPTDQCSAFLQVHAMQSSRIGKNHSAGCPEMLGNLPPGSNCPKPTWVDAMMDADPSPGKVFMDVGCNKGDDAIEWMERWGPGDGHFWSKKRWVKALEAAGIQHFACGKPDTNIKRAIPSAETARPTSVCIEPMNANVMLLKNLSAQLGYDRTVESGSFHIVHAALSDKAEPNQTVEFQAGNQPGDELGHISALQTPVPLSTVDTVASELRLPRVDVLTIDTEGFDPAVIYGANSTLLNVRYLEFEVHRDLKNSPWGYTTLKSIVTHLDTLGFTCYWAGNNGRLLNMNRCWSEKFELGGWNNAACVKRNDVWAEVLEVFSN